MSLTSGSIGKSSKSSKDNLHQDSQSSYEEGDFVCGVDEVFLEEASKNPNKSTEYYYQGYKYVKPKMSDYERKEVKRSKLFDKTKKVDVQDEDKIREEIARDGSILVTGFGMRNVESFQKLLKMSHEERKKWELRKLWRDQKVEREPFTTKQKKHDETTARSEFTDVSTSTESKVTKSSSDILSQTESTAQSSVDGDQKRHLEYLLELESAIEEEDIIQTDLEEKLPEDDFNYSSSKSIRETQKYLRTHRIFEFYQFIVAHLLSANAENPIEFILNLLNKCLLYRSGLGEPPLLYDKKHINQLFTLMDRLKCGLIEINQYKTGMKTLGICTFNEVPEATDEGLIVKDIFIEEAYEAELAIFNDLIKRRVVQKKKRSDDAVSFDAFSVPSLNSPYFIPSDLFRFSSRKLAETQHLESDLEG